jgi:hypothetical protein
MQCNFSGPAPAVIPNFNIQLQGSATIGSTVLPSFSLSASGVRSGNTFTAEYNVSGVNLRQLMPPGVALPPFCSFTA